MIILHLSELQQKEIINITSGKRLGMIIDVIVDTSGKIKSLVVEERRGRKFTGREDYQINWDQIIKIGDDIILIDTREHFK